MFLTFICRALTMTISKTFCWFLTCFLFLFSWFIFIMANENTYTHSFLSTNKLLRNSFYTLCYMLIVLKSFLWAKQNLTVFKIAIFSYSLLPKIFRFRRSSLRLVFLIKIVYNIVWTPPPPHHHHHHHHHHHFQSRGEVNFDCLPGRGNLKN